MSNEYVIYRLKNYMKDNNSTKLFTDFSQLYEDDFMHERGFECKDGWFDLIYDLSSSLQKQENASEIRVSQVKQKMGHLVYRVKNLTDEINKIITQTQNKAKETCEMCGSDNSVLNMCKRHYIVLCKYCSSLGNNAYDCVTYEEYSKKMENQWKLE